MLRLISLLGRDYTLEVRGDTTSQPNIVVG